MNKEIKTPKSESEEIQEWDLTQEFGIFPKDVSLTQNIGCVGGKKKKGSSSNAKKD